MLLNNEENTASSVTKDEEVLSLLLEGENEKESMIKNLLFSAAREGNVKELKNLVCKQALYIIEFFNDHRNQSTNKPTKYDPSFTLYAHMLGWNYTT